MREYEEQSYVRVLPKRVRDAFRALPPAVCNNVEEIRLRLGHAVVLRGHNFEEWLHDTSGSLVTTQDMLDFVLEQATDHSPYAADAYLRQGFITIQGGHRIGICGQVVLEENQIKTLRDLSSVSVRIARAVPEYAQQLRGAFDPREGSVLIIGPPGAGKTTLLREVTRLLSDLHRRTVSLVDERFEVAACRKGKATFDVGKRTDILSGCQKSEGMLLMLRTMTPQWLVVDEITRPEDIAAMEQVAYCGVKLAATAHASDPSDLQNRELYQRLLKHRIFTTLISIDENRKLQVEKLL